MTKASEKLFVTQQCLSRQIKGVEDELGVKLFTRKKTGMTPTEICRRIYPEFRKILYSYDNIRAICGGEGENDEPRLTIAMAVGMSNYIDFSLLSNLIKSFTGRDLLIQELPSDDCSKMLQSGESDMAFLVEPFDDMTLEHALVYKDYGYIAMHKNHPLAADSGPIPMSMLDGIRIITGIPTNCATEHFWRYCRQTGVHPNCVASVANTTGLLNRLSQENVVVTVLSKTIPQITNPEIVFRRIVEPELLGKCHCCFRANSKNADLFRSLMLRISDCFLSQTMD